MGTKKVRMLTVSELSQMRRGVVVARLVSGVAPRTADAVLGRRCALLRLFRVPRSHRAGFVVGVAERQSGAGLSGCASKRRAPTGNCATSTADAARSGRIPRYDASSARA